MNCQKVQNLISAYLDGELAGQEMLAIRHHLNDCAECSYEYESLLAIKRTFGKLHPKRPADDLAARICSRLVEVHIPFHVRMTAAIRRSFDSFHTGMRVGVAGIAVIAALLMVRGGDVSIPSQLAGIPISSATLKAFAEERPLRLVPVSAEAAARHPAAAYNDQQPRWQTADGGAFTPVSRTGSLLLAGYTP